jgi:predicted HicB family RNase H-like nuclease
MSESTKVKAAVKKSADSPAVKARQALEMAREKADGCEDWAEFWNYLFGIGGKLGELFPTQAERVAFSKTPESKEIMKILEELQGDDDDLPEKLALARGQFILRLPKSLHAALMAEAQAEGVSLNQLCMAKLATQLRASLFLKG